MTRALTISLALALVGCGGDKTSNDKPKPVADKPAAVRPEANSPNGKTPGANVITSGPTAKLTATNEGKPATLAHAVAYTYPGTQTIHLLFSPKPLDCNKVTEAMFEPNTFGLTLIPWWQPTGSTTWRLRTRSQGTIDFTTIGHERGAAIKGTLSYDYLGWKVTGSFDTKSCGPVGKRTNKLPPVRKQNLTATYAGRKLIFKGARVVRRGMSDGDQVRTVEFSTSPTRCEPPSISSDAIFSFDFAFTNVDPNLKLKAARGVVAGGLDMGGDATGKLLTTVDKGFTIKLNAPMPPTDAPLTGTISGKASHGHYKLEIAGDFSAIRCDK